MDSQTLINEVNHIATTINEFKTAVRDFVKHFYDESIDFETRWNSFLILSETGLLIHDTYSDGNVEKLRKTDGSRVTLQDDLYIDRGVTITFNDMYTEIIDKGEDYFEPESIEEWKKAVLENGYGSFRYDW